jgi:predicted KAP-like P-loop ATPase
MEDYFLIPDTVVTEVKKFSFDKYVKTIVRLISDKKNKTPLTLAIHGGWGSGKTSLMKTIENVLKNNREFNKYYTKKERDFQLKKTKIIWFNAWEFESKGDIAFSLLTYIATELKNEFKDEEMINKVKVFLSTIGQIILDKALQKITSFSLDDLKEFKNSYDEYFESFESGVNAILTIRHKYKDLVDQYFKNNPIKHEQIIVFIDDLDRCSIEKSKDLIDSIKLFLNIQNCIFILGIDLDRLEFSLDYKYGEKLKFNAREYLDKIVQLRFDLPPISKNDMKDFLKEIAPKDFKDNYISIITEGLNPNPRNMKIFMNLIRFQLLLSKYQDFKINKNLLIEWLVLKRINPEFTKDIELDTRMLSLYHNKNIISEFNKCKDDNERQTFLNKYKGLKTKFLENSKLLNILQLNRSSFKIEELKNIIFQTKTANSIDKLTFELEFYREKLKEQIKKSKEYFQLNEIYLSLDKSDKMRLLKKIKIIEDEIELGKLKIAEAMIHELNYDLRNLEKLLLGISFEDRMKR